MSVLGEGRRCEAALGKEENSVSGGRGSLDLDPSGRICADGFDVSAGRGSGPREGGGCVQAIELRNDSQSKQRGGPESDQNQNDRQPGGDRPREPPSSLVPPGHPAGLPSASGGAIEMGPHPNLAEPADWTPAVVAAAVRAPASVDRTGDVHAGIMTGRET